MECHFIKVKTDFGKVSLQKATRWTTKSKKEAKIDDILITLRAPAGVVNFANINLSIGRGLASIRCLQNIEKLYIYYFLKNNENKINIENDKGGFFSSMSKDYLHSIQVPIPKDLDNYTSYQIQKIIADFINEVDDEIQQSFDKIDKGYDAVKRYKRAYLCI